VAFGDNALKADLPVISKKPLINNWGHMTPKKKVLVFEAKGEYYFPIHRLAQPLSYVLGDSTSARQKIKFVNHGSHAVYMWIPSLGGLCTYVTCHARSICNQPNSQILKSLDILHSKLSFNTHN